MTEIKSVKIEKWMAVWLVVISAFAGNVFGARNSYIYASGIRAWEDGWVYNSYHMHIDGDATNNTGITETKMGNTGSVIGMGAQAGFGKAVFNLDSTAYRADGINNTLAIFSSANSWAATSSAGSVGAMARTLGGFFDAKSTRIRHDGANWTTTTIISQPLQFGCAIGGLAGLYVTPSAAYAGTRWISSSGDAQLSSTAATGCASTEGGALYYLDGVGSFHIDESGVGTGPLSGGSGGIGISAVVAGGALVNVGGIAKVWDDSFLTLTAIDFGSGTHDEITVAVAFGDDALLQTASNGMFYYDSSAGSVVSVADAELLGGVTAGDFALVSLAGTGFSGAYFYKDTGAGTYHSWQHGSDDQLTFGGVGGYAEVIYEPVEDVYEPADAGLFLIGTPSD